MFTNFQYFNQFSLFLPTDDDDSGESKSHRSRLDPDACTDDDHDDDHEDDYDDYTYVSTGLGHMCPNPQNGLFQCFKSIFISKIF